MVLGKLKFRHRPRLEISNFPTVFFFCNFEFKYKFKITKEENSWKIAYLEGFDFKESTRKDGQL